MNNEIKEILARLSRYVITPDVRHDFDDLLDYITNLQQENERLKRKLTTKKLFKKYKVEKDVNFELRKIFELQQRIEKAVEYIKEHEYDIRINFGCYVKGNELLNILNGKE